MSKGDDVLGGFLLLALLACVLREEKSEVRQVPVQLKRSSTPVRNTYVSEPKSCSGCATSGCYGYPCSSCGYCRDCKPHCATCDCCISSGSDCGGC